MKTSRLTYLFLFLFSAAFVACDKSDDPEPDPGGGGSTTTYDPGKVIIDFSNMANGHGVNLSGTTAYSNNLSQAFRPRKFRYYVSNIVLVKDDGTEFSVPDIYQLVDDSIVATRKITCNNVPGGKYKSVRFLLGVDAARVAAGNFTGDLDPAKGMYWNSTDGFAAVELYGTTNYSPDSTFSFRIGGIGSNNALKTITCSFGTQTLIVDGARNATLHLYAEILEMFKVPQDINFTNTHHVTTPGTDAVMMANNYADMFRFDHMHN